MEKTSSWYETEPFGFAAQPDFLNLVVALRTPCEPEALLAALHAIEDELGRRRAGPRYGPRTIDLDLLLLGARRAGPGGDAPGVLQLPHPGIADRAFVLVPLAEIAPGLRIPGLDATAAELRDALPAAARAGVRRVAGPEGPPGGGTALRRS